MLGSFLAQFARIRNLATPFALLFALLLALAGRSSAQQVQWAQSPINGHWYGAEYSPRTWTDSEALAVGMGGHLATIRSQPEQDWLQNTFGFANGTAGGLWIGLSDAAIEGTWTWTSGDTSTYTNWGPTEPSGGTSENYCQVYPIGSLSPWQWNDAPNNVLNPNARAIVEGPSLPARSWSWPGTYHTGQNPHYGCIADFDGDGNLDYASADFSVGQISIFLGDGFGSFGYSQTIGGLGTPIMALAIDLDGDGDLDLVATDLSGQVWSVTNNGIAGFAPSASALFSVPNAHGVSSGDLNGDGIADLVVASASPDSSVRVFLGQSGGGFALAQTIPALHDNYQATLIDYDGDGHLDAVLAGDGVGTPSGVLLLNGSAAGTLTPAGYIGTGAAVQAAAGDVDGDGLPDLVIPRANQNTLEVWRNSGAGNFQITQTLSTGGAPHWCSLADVDGDGSLDAVVPNNFDSTVYVYRNNAGGQFTLDQTLAGLSNPPWLGCVDLNHDGKPDILCSMWTFDGFAVTLNQSIFDCNHNGVEDAIDIQSGSSADCDGDLHPDECQIAMGYARDCNVNGILDSCEIASNPSLDLDHNGVLDSCQNPGTPYCFGDGTGHACPCDPGQIGSPGHGCANSSGEGAILSATGAVSVTGDSLQLHVANMPNPSSVLFFQGTVQQGSGLGTFNGDGLLCVNGIAGSLIRLGAHGAQPGSSDFGAGIGNDPLISVRGQIPAIGGTRYYQAWYRDNTAFCAPQPYNFSNGLSITWTP